jgi:hypothetical protein
MPEAPDPTPAPTQEPKPLKSTLNLPQTSFPMKAGLPVNEPIRLKQWEDQDLYGQIRRARAGSPRYILHDGPPYANGAIHLGHALNKTLKDFVVKTKTMAGLGLPRAADRDQGRRATGAEEAGDGPGGGAAGVSRVRAEVPGPTALAVFADGHLWPLV